VVNMSKLNKSYALGLRLGKLIQEIGEFLPKANQEKQFYDGLLSSCKKNLSTHGFAVMDNNASEEPDKYTIVFKGFFTTMGLCQYLGMSYETLLKKITAGEIVHDIELPDGTKLYDTTKVQETMKEGIVMDNLTMDERMLSTTERKILQYYKKDPKLSISADNLHEQLDLEIIAVLPAVKNLVDKGYIEHTIGSLYKYKGQ